MSKSRTSSKSSISVLGFSTSLYLCNHLSESIHSWTKGVPYHTIPYPTLPPTLAPTLPLPYPILYNPILSYPYRTPPLPYPNPPHPIPSLPLSLPYPTLPSPTPAPTLPLPLPYPYRVMSLSKTYLSPPPKVLVIPRKRLLCPNVTEKLFTWTLSFKQTKPNLPYPYPYPTLPIPSIPILPLLLPLPIPFPLRIRTHAHNQDSCSRATLSCDISSFLRTKFTEKCANEKLTPGGCLPRGYIHV